MIKKIIAVIIVACLIISGAYVYFEYYAKEDKEVEEKVPEKVIDERISPMVPQAVFFEINRIRRNGIIDQITDGKDKIDFNLPVKNINKVYNPVAIDGLRPGIGWRKKPVFNYIIVLDDYEYVPPMDFETWDTDYINYEIFRKVEPEQPTAEIEFKLIDKQKKLFRTIDRATESFNVTYDFKTGRWSGDDYFNDSDGYGHYNGTNFEMWFKVRQTDYDADGIPYWTEVNILETDPRVNDLKLDPDNDGVPTVWEWQWGYNPHQWDNHTYLDPDNDGLQNVEEWFMSKWLANPFYPEIYLETDFMERTPFKPFIIKMDKGRILPITRPRIIRTTFDGSVNVFWEESQQMLIERFHEHGITLHIDDGIMGGGGEYLPFLPRGYYNQDAGYIAEFYKNNFADERKGIFRYLITAHGGGWAHPQDFKHYYDCMTAPSHLRFYKDFLTFAISPRAQRIGKAIQVLHEIGHTLGLSGDTTHPGVDNTSLKYGNDPNYPWYDYVSVMSYQYFTLRYFDYSDGSRGENDFNDWDNLDLTYFQRPVESMEGLGS